MGRRYAEGGVEQARAILADLAADPHTAEHLSRKIAIHFVADDPPGRRAYYRLAGLRGGPLPRRLHPVRGAVCRSPQPTKFKRPYEFLVSSYRAVGAAPQDGDREVLAALTQLGERPFSAPQPNGWSEQAGDWAAPDAVVKRLDWSSRFAAAQPFAAQPVDVADAAQGAPLTPPLPHPIARAETRPEALTLFLMSPEFQRR